MSDQVVFDRRDFLRLVGLGVAGAAGGCAPPAERLIPYLVPPNDVLPGIPVWYASTCTECSAGCGILVKQREGRAIKIEGNPAHPINQGGLCARGQAALQGLYDADRVRTPLRKDGGAWKAITWEEGLALAAERLGAARGNLALLTNHATGSIQRLASEWTAAFGGTHLMYEPFAYESVREANRRSFGVAAVPQYDFAAARFVISFGADFLETFGSPMAQARGFAAMRHRTDGSGRFVAVEPRLSLTGSNADEWIAVRPGGEMALALGMANVLLAGGAGGGVAGAGEAVAAFTPDVVEKATDVPAATIQRLAAEFVAQQPSLAIAGGIAAQSEQSVALLQAVNLLNAVAGNVGRTVRFDRPLNVDGVATFAELQTLASRMAEGQVQALVVAGGANPVYAVPAWANFAAAMDKVPFKVSLSAVLDETTEHCDLILPSTHSLETLGDAEPARGVLSIVQPAMQRVPVFDARPAGDTLLELGRRAGVGAAWPANWTAYVQGQWRGAHGRAGRGRDFDAFWRESLQAGGVFEDAPAASVGFSGGGAAFAAPEPRGAGDYHLVVYPTIAFHDGRGANKPWLQELPDPVTKAVWGSWAEIHPETARKLGVINGQPVKVETDAGAVELPAYVYAGVRPDVIAIPLGQGHTAYGRHAKGRGINALSLLPPAQDAASGAIAYAGARARLSKAAKAMDLVMTQREKIQTDRAIAQVIPLSALLATAAPAAHGAAAHADTTHGGAAGGHGAANGHGAAAHHEVHPSQTRPGKHTEPLQRPADWKPPAHAVTAYEPDHKARSARQEPIRQGSYGKAKHRWAMAIDLSSCTGCSACITACQAENNIPTVGAEMIKRGREMHWIRIERYEEKLTAAATGGAASNDVRFIPMLCQHCSDAPCETVCPVFATYHNPEGLNAQVYNRCVGTRYCSNNCPYKVRAFNFFDYSAPEKASYAFPEPLNWQLNPDVTVRSKGVMEKCTFCIQRIMDGKSHARDENRDLRDGEFTTACAQSCPSRAIVFGDLMDEASEVHRLSRTDDRRYWVLNDLNTKPGITYLKKLQRDSA